ncbi:MAG: hypothetical protein ATN31_01065 [Candidatus Epulonipiscioides saccharophilum]|nr:MAG: hypothetical protein ATN31_01065 [Epulopiscium sp. AS2M-Bin001]
MRLVVASHNHVGKKLAYPIRTNRGLLFMPHGKELTEILISRIQNLGVTYIYVEEKFSEEVIMELSFEELIKEDIIKHLTSLYINIQKTQIVDERLVHFLVQLILNNINLSENAVFYREPTDNEYDKLALHSLEVAFYCINIAKHRRMRIQELEKIIASALLHDIGKLLDDTRGSHEERAVNILRRNPNIAPLVYVPILHLHEKIDGTGKFKVPKDKLHVHSQILHLTNNYSNHIEKFSDINQRVEMMNMEAGTRYDLKVFKNAMEVLYCYPNGLMVTLTNATQGLVCKQNIGFPSRPVIVRLDGHVIDLMKEPTIFIKEIIS